MTTPAVSVVTPAYNGEAWLPATLDSLAAQTFGDFEVIVVDDGSADRTRELVIGWPDPRVRLLTMPRNGGPVLARNAGVAVARGRFIAGLDQDDLCRPARFAQQVAYLRAHPDCVLVGTQVEFLRDGAISPSTYPPATTPGLIDWLLGIENPLAWSSVMIRADAARALMPFTRPDRVYAEDFDLYQRLRPLGTLARLDEPLVIYRQHAGGVSKRYAETMCAAATAVLAERHAALGEGAGRAAALIVAHLMTGAPAPDRATLVELGALLASLEAAYIAAHRPDATTRKLIKWETARRWARIGRAGLRSGSLGLADVLAVRPPHLGLGYAGAAALAASGAVGAGRRVVRRAAS